MTDTGKNITLSQTSFARANKVRLKQFQTYWEMQGRTVRLHMWSCDLCKGLTSVSQQLVWLQLICINCWDTVQLVDTKLLLLEGSSVLNWTEPNETQLWLRLLHCTVQYLKYAPFASINIWWLLIGCLPWPSVWLLLGCGRCHIWNRSEIYAQIECKNYIHQCE